MSGEKNNNSTVLAFASAITSKINGLISSHNSNTSAHSDKESVNNKVTSWSSPTSNNKYASEKLVKDSLDNKQDTLVSGTSIKTINNESLLGSGNLTIESNSGSNVIDYYWDPTTEEVVLVYGSGGGSSGGGSIDIDSTWIANSTNPVESQLIQTALNAKQDTLISGTSLKTINNQSLLGSGNISITGGSGSSECLTDFSYDTTNDELVLEYCTGKLIDNISKSTSGNVDTYTITYTDSSTYQFSVTNGSGSNITIDSDWITNSTNPIQSKVIKTALDTKANSSGLSTVATTGSYSDLLNKPTIPIKISDLTNDSSFISTSNTSGLMKNDGTIDTSTYLTTGSASSTYVAKETGKGLFSGSYADLTNKPSYTPTITNSTTGSYEIGKINISGTDVTIYGKDTHQSLTNYVQKSQTVGLMKNDGTIDTNSYSLTVHTHNEYINPTIADNLTTNSSTQVLSAKQGKVLDEKIGDIITIINGTGS